MAKKILVIDDEKMRWRMLHNFEHKQKVSFLKKLTAGESLEMLRNLYLFAQKTADKPYYKRPDLRKIHSLSKIHFMFMKVNL